MTAKPLQRGNDDSEVLKFKDFQGPLTSNSKTFKALFHFQGLSRSSKMGKNFKDFQELSRPCGHPGSYNSERILFSVVGNKRTELSIEEQESSVTNTHSMEVSSPSTLSLISPSLCWSGRKPSSLSSDV